MCHAEVTTKTKKTYEELIWRIVQGQVSSFIHDHPEALKIADDWKTPPSKTKKQQVVDSIAKRICFDLTSPQTRRMLSEALALEHATGVEGI